MDKDRIKTLSNMVCILPKIEIKDYYTEEDYFYVYQLIYGFKNLEEYFDNKDIINDILNMKIENYILIDMIRVVRNRHSHVDKNNNIDQLLLLQVSVNKSDIHKLINEIKKGMDNIFSKQLNNDSYKLMMNTKFIINMFELVKKVINSPDSKNEFDRKSKELVKPIINNFKYDDSTLDDFNAMSSQIIEFFKLSEVKDGIVKMYGEDTYSQLLRMLCDDSFTEEEASDLLNVFKKDNCQNDL